MATKKAIEVKKIVLDTKHYALTIQGLGGMLMNKQPDLSKPKTAGANQKKVDKLAEEQKNWREKLYFRDDIGVYVPGENLQECLTEGAKYWGQKIPGEGNKTYTDLVKSAMIVEDMPLGNGKPLAKDDETIIFPFGRNVNGTPTKATPALVYKIRPLIRPWQGTVILHVFDSRLDKNILETIACYAGTFRGLCDWRPKFGRFDVVELEEVTNVEINI